MYAFNSVCSLEISLKNHVNLLSFFQKFEFLVVFWIGKAEYVYVYVISCY